MKRYIVTPGGFVQEADDLLEWARWYEAAHDTRFEDGGLRVARDELPGDVRVSTVFLGLETPGSGSFETMIFGGPHAHFQRRYDTVGEAREGHARALSLAKGDES